MLDRQVVGRKTQDLEFWWLAVVLKNDVKQRPSEESPPNVGSSV